MSRREQRRLRKYQTELNETMTEFWVADQSRSHEWQKFLAVSLAVKYVKPKNARATWVEKNRG